MKIEKGDVVCLIELSFYEELNSLSIDKEYVVYAVEKWNSLGGVIENGFLYPKVMVINDKGIFVHIHSDSFRITDVCQRNKTINNILK